MHTIAFSHDGTGLVTAGFDRNVCLWHSTGGPAHLLPLRLPEHATVTTVAFGPDDTHLVTGDTTGTVRTWDLTTGTVGRAYLAHSGTIGDLRFSADGTALITAGMDGNVLVRDAVGHAPVAILRGPRHGVTAVSLTRDGGSVLASGNNGPVLMWRL